ncbi:hypothetical protein BGX38DRAFT_546130 [Terfezia claveryi]|nr:hypothetical protein BGX38DRAFT_546130 [Terfezia claveryi]
MAANTQNARAALLRLSKIWPPDPLRPDLSFSNFLAARAEALSATPQSPPGAFGKSPLDVQVKALAELSAGKFAKKYPLSDKILRPPAMPDYYERLVREMEEAPQRSWLQRMLNSWKGYIRMG